MEMKTVIKYIALLATLVISTTCSSQIIYQTDNKYEADYVVFITPNKYEAFVLSGFN